MWYVYVYSCVYSAGRLNILDTDSDETSSADGIPVSAFIVLFLLHMHEFCSSVVRCTVSEIWCALLVCKQ